MQDYAHFYPTVTPVFHWVNNARRTHKIVIEQGGTWSSKTYSIMQVIGVIACSEPDKVITVTGQDLPNLKRGALRDFEAIIGTSDVLKSYIKKVNASTHTYTFINNTTIEFTTYKDGQDARNGKRDYLFINEVNGVKEEIYDELSIRTGTNIFLDYNASRSFWVHDKLLNQPDTIRHISNFTHNPHIPKSVLDGILSYKETNPYRWRVFGLGQTGELKENLWLDAFSRTRHVQPVEYNRNEPVHISIDFNVGKFCAIAFQCSDIDNHRSSYFNVIDEFVLLNANIQEMAQKIRNRFGNTMLFVTGDQTGAKRDTGYSQSNDTLLNILQRELNISNKQMLFGAYNKRYSESNPSHQNSWAHCNNVLAHHPNFRIAAHCRELINDCEIAIFVENKNTFQLKKGDGAGKWAMNALDCLRYAIAAKCPSYAKGVAINT